MACLICVMTMSPDIDDDEDDDDDDGDDDDDNQGSWLLDVGLFGWVPWDPIQ